MDDSYCLGALETVAAPVVAPEAADASVATRTDDVALLTTRHAAADAVASLAMMMPTGFDSESDDVVGSSDPAAAVALGLAAAAAHLDH